MPIKEMGNQTILFLLWFVSLCLFVPYSYALTYEYVSAWMIVVIVLPLVYFLMNGVADHIVCYNRCPACREFGNVVVEKEVLTETKVEIDSSSSDHEGSFGDWEESGPSKLERKRETERIDTDITTTIIICIAKNVAIDGLIKVRSRI